MVHSLAKFKMDTKSGSNCSRNDGDSRERSEIFELDDAFVILHPLYLSDIRNQNSYLGNYLVRLSARLRRRLSGRAWVGGSELRLPTIYSAAIKSKEGNLEKSRINRFKNDFYIPSSVAKSCFIGQSDDTSSLPAKHS